MRSAATVIEPAQERDTAGSHNCLFAVRVDEPCPGLAIARLQGELDLSTEPVLDRVLDRVLSEVRPRLLVLDLAGLRFVAASGVSLLVRLHARAATDSGMRLQLAEVPDAVARVLRLAGVSTLFDIDEMPENAVADRSR